jgi:hypothetical protein
VATRREREGETRLGGFPGGDGDKTTRRRRRDARPRELGMGRRCVSDGGDATWRWNGDDEGWRGGRYPLASTRRRRDGDSMDGVDGDGTGVMRGDVAPCLPERNRSEVGLGATRLWHGAGAGSVRGRVRRGCWHDARRT